MSASDLLAAVGGAWSRLLVWPGGVALVLLVWQRWRHSTLPPSLQAIGAWLVLALLPLPGAANSSIALDGLTALVLLEAWRAATPITARVQAGWGVAFAGVLLLSRPSGSLILDRLAAAPSASTPLPWMITHWLGAALLISAACLLATRQTSGLYRLAWFAVTLVPLGVPLIGLLA